MERYRPKAALIKNVSHLSSHSNGRTLKTIIGLLEGMGYSVTWTTLNARHFGLPQQRRRIFIAALRPGYGPFRWPILRRPCQSIDALIETGTPPRYYASAAVRHKTKTRLAKEPPEGTTIWHTNLSGAVTARPYSAALRAHGSHNYLLVNGERHLTEREMLWLQGFPERFQLSGSYTQAKSHIGNAVAVPAASAALRSVQHALTRPLAASDSRKGSRSQIRRLADALANISETWEAHEDIIDMSAECAAALKQMLFRY